MCLPVGCRRCHCCSALGRRHCRRAPSAPGHRLKGTALKMRSSLCVAREYTTWCGCMHAHALLKHSCSSEKAMPIFTSRAAAARPAAARAAAARAAPAGASPRAWLCMHHYQQQACCCDCQQRPAAPAPLSCSCHGCGLSVLGQQVPALTADLFLAWIGPSCTRPYASSLCC